MSWELDNAEKRSEKHPATFIIPPIEVRETLRTGWYAKLLFCGWDSRGKVACERMWAKILAVSEGPVYEGVLANVPAILSGIAKGDKVSFQAKHVSDYVDG